MSILLKNQFSTINKCNLYTLLRCFTNGCVGLQDIELTNSVKIKLEEHWRNKVNCGNFNPQNGTNKFYVLSMFPYPSGNLHMGHVRVYTISDAMARFHRMNGRNVFHPIGWDAFGLPAENAAIERKVEPAAWTEQNIAQMKRQLERLGCSFDWRHELSTCDEKYFKWTQKLFLMLYQRGMIYQKEALVNWDPIDKTVLADEQVDANGCSWRSGAKVEKKLLKQWFVRTTKFAEALLKGLDDPLLQDWRDIINLQKHWIGECNGYDFNLHLEIEGDGQESKFIRIWTTNPEYLTDPSAFVIVKTDNYLNKFKKSGNLKVKNPFTNRSMSVICHDDAPFAEHCDVYLAAPNMNESAKTLADSLSIPIEKMEFTKTLMEKNCSSVLQVAKENNIGGCKVSSKLQDWLISRQRYWGTPIPIIYCDSCGAVPVDEQSLPVRLPFKNQSLENDHVTCPKCSKTNCMRETDTMDTFVDSSWYYLRFLDAQNHEKIFNEKLINQCMPVDLYIGGKEHAVLHLYYARFMNHFLHSIGMVPHPEPFKRLLVQGMVKGRSFRVKKSGRYLKEDQVEIIDAKKNKAIEKGTGEQVIMSWEKMSKSKNNGVDPSDMISEYGCDTTRLIVLGDVAPMSHRNWSTATFPGILNWQNRLWLTVNEFYQLRTSPLLEQHKTTEEQFISSDDALYDARNYYIKGATFHYRHTHQLSVAISKMQGLTNSLRRTPKDVIKLGKHYERALASQIIMLAPMAPHFTSELWSKFVSTPNKINVNSNELKWDADVLEQHWPDVDQEYNLDFTVKINGLDIAVIKMPRYKLDKLTYNEAMDIAFNSESVINFLIDKKVKNTSYVLYPGCDATLSIFFDRSEKSKQSSIEKKVKQ